MFFNLTTLNMTFNDSIVNQSIFVKNLLIYLAKKKTDKILVFVSTLTILLSISF